MPIPGARYRWKNGVRLAFVGNKVVETKKKGGEAHMVSPKKKRKRTAVERLMEKP